MKNSIKKRFGTIAIEKGYISEKQLIEALEIQVKENVSGLPHRLIGEILIEKGYLLTEQAEEIAEILNQNMLYVIAAGR